MISLNSATTWMLRSVDCVNLNCCSDHAFTPQVFRGRDDKVFHFLRKTQ